MITTGAQTCNSNHSLLIVSIKTERCSSHLPETAKLSQLSKSIFIQTFVSSSFSSLSLICLEVTNFHSFQAKGELFTRNSILRVGSSIVIGVIASTVSFSAIVSQTNISGIQAIVTISQATASLTFTLFNHSVVSISDIFHFLFTHSFEVITTSCQTFTLPS